MKKKKRRRYASQKFLRTLEGNFHRTHASFRPTKGMDMGLIAQLATILLSHRGSNR